MRPEVVDGRDRRSRAIDEEVEEWAKRMGIRIRRYPSEEERERGLILRRRYGLVQCPECPFLFIVRSGQKMGTCPRCGRRFWLHGAFVVATSDSQERLRTLIPVIWGNIGGGKWRFLPELGVV